MDKPIEHALYSIKDQYFQDFPRGSNWMDNKGEKRPYYYLLRDKDGIIWVIPMSTQAENYRKKIEKIELKRGEGNCIYYHIGKIAGKERVFLIGDMFPIDATYIKAPFTIASVHYICKDSNLNRALYSKSMRFIKLIESGVIHSRTNIMGIKKELLNRK